MDQDSLEERCGRIVRIERTGSMLLVCRHLQIVFCTSFVVGMLMWKVGSPAAVAIDVMSYLTSLERM